MSYAVRTLLALLACTLLACTTRHAPPAELAPAVYLYPAGTSTMDALAGCRGGEVIWHPSSDRFACETR